ncbi:MULTISPECIES: phage tail assembly protein T [Kosakonia]|uniref:Phage tail assembly protein T n=1 Tax=Kosakonia oryzae TaxID=497725 RepID=A0AA94H5B5_9ENTR|nr:MULTISPECIES: phage tail assembly protein T [Kosakonia]ANI82415.1 phage tail assembly protein T [Kosakonia oryzae]SFC57335.1 phage tail assembly protein T [Kosakonia oryzae]VVT52179.1 Phage minor tail protein [Kosakonia radicincitans]
MKLAREFGRPDWRAMLSAMSSTELAEWGDFYRVQLFSNDLLDNHFACLSHLVVDMMCKDHGLTPADFSLLNPLKPFPEQDDETMMHLAEGISGGKRYGPASG